jgi:hypothetical protein
MMMLNRIHVFKRNFQLSWRGGALHPSNSCPNRKIIMRDPFNGFEKLDPVSDRNFAEQTGKNTTREPVDRSFRHRQRDYTILAGFFPRIAKKFHESWIASIRFHGIEQQSTDEEYVAFPN